MKVNLSKDELPAKYEFIEGPFPKGFNPDYEPSLFNSESHRKLQSPQDWHSFHIIRRDKKKILSSIYFCINKGIASSPRSAPFGSFELSETITTAQLFEFIIFYEKRLTKYGAKRILIKNYPEAYHSRQHNILSVVLFNHDYAIQNAELGACLRIEDTPFIDRIDQWEKRKLKQALKASLTCRAIPSRKLKETYQFISDCREERGQLLSMSFEDLNRTVKKLDTYFFSFGVYSNARLIAASISIKVNKTTLYNFYSAHSRESDSMSPTVFLTSEMYSWCSTHKIRILDLGTSALGGVPNFSLIDFKLRLGAEPTMKLTFEKALN